MTRAFWLTSLALASSTGIWGCSASAGTTPSDTSGGTNAAGGRSASGGASNTAGQNAAGAVATGSGGSGASGGAMVGTQGGSGSASQGGASPGSGGANTTLGGNTNAGATGGGAKSSGGSANGGSPQGGAQSKGGSSSGGAATGGSASGGSAQGGSAGAASCPVPAPGSKGTNPLFSDQFTADPAPFVYNCTFYIQCGHDEAAAGQNGFVMREWFLLASTDMVHWTKNVALKLTDFKWANANAWAGQMVTKNGKFYWYVPVQESATGTMTIGVAVANSPTGPFTDAIGKPLINDTFEMSNVGFASAGDTPFTIDPSVFVDDDGQAYMHYGSFGRMMIAKLNPDMISINGKMQENTPPGFFEAAFLTKRNGTYYEIYAAGANPAAIDYATSTSPLGPWTRKGRVLDAFTAASGQDAPTNHSGVAQFGNQWYIVYHLSNGPNGGGTYRREVAIDKLTFNADGTIQKVVPSTGLTF